jgi:hypothetical protein
MTTFPRFALLILACSFLPACPTDIRTNPECTGQACDDLTPGADAAASIASDIRVTPPSMLLEVGGLGQFTVSLVDQNGATLSSAQMPSFAGADTGIVSMNGGSVTGLAVGTTTVTVSLEGFQKQATIQVEGEDDPLKATAACCPLANDPTGNNDNICDVPPDSADCGPTQPGGYCDPNGDGLYDDGDWQRGYYDWLGEC